MVSPQPPGSEGEDEKHRPSFLQRFLVTAACPVALVLVAARGSLDDLSAPFLLAALVFGYIAAALTKTWFASIVGSMLAGVALVVLVVVLFDAACSNSNGDCL